MTRWVGLFVLTCTAATGVAAQEGRAPKRYEIAYATYLGGKTDAFVVKLVPVRQ